MDKKILLEKAQRILLENLYEVELNRNIFRRTVPSKEFYVHQWNWDSATHAMGLVYVDEQRAFDELKSLVSGQWENGLIAQITFNPKETKYFPGPEFWGTEKFANGEIITSGITQPPLLGVSFVHVYSVSKSEVLKVKLIKEILPHIVRYHTYLKEFRDTDNDGLLTVVHPWESGTDNSPRWDEPLKNIDLEFVSDEVKITVNRYRSDDKLGDPRHRPGLEDYYKYMHLVQLFKNLQWDYKKIVAESPFAVKDVLFNSIWCKANELLGELFKNIGDNANAELFADWAEQTRSALLKVWDDEKKIFRDFDVSTGNTIEENTIATFMPLWAGAVNEEILGDLFNKLEDKGQYWTEVPVPTCAVNSPKFELTRYWRGPTWPITNLFLIEGLDMYPGNEKAAELKKKLVRKTIGMIMNSGFYEYYDPLSGKARPGKNDTVMGFGSFSWTAAITIYILNKYKDFI